MNRVFSAYLVSNNYAFMLLIFTKVVIVFDGNTSSSYYFSLFDRFIILDYFNIFRQKINTIFCLVNINSIKLFQGDTTYTHRIGCHKRYKPMTTIELKKLSRG